MKELDRYRPVPVQQTMIHGDCTTDNVLVKDGEVYLFIDTAGISAGDPRYDESLAISHFVTNEACLNAFTKAIAAIVYQNKNSSILTTVYMNF